MKGILDKIRQRRAEKTEREEVGNMVYDIQMGESIKKILPEGKTLTEAERELKTALLGQAKTSHKGLKEKARRGSEISASAYRTIERGR